MVDVLDQVKTLLHRAKEHREAHKWDAALSEFEAARDKLQAALSSWSGAIGGREHTAVAHALSDCFGQMGGVYRRKNDLARAQGMYHEGCQIEQDSRYRIVDTYCLVNELVVSLLRDPDALRERYEEFEQARRICDKQTRGQRRGDWWAWADVGLMTALTSVQVQEALVAYVEYARTSAQAEDYASTVVVLDEIAEALRWAAPEVAGRLEHIRDELEQHARVALPKRSCFVLMPFREKQDVDGRTIDFDAIYRDLIRPAIEDAGLDAVRADHDRLAGGFVHSAMLKRLRMSDFAVADLTTSNPNVFYELGIRHGSAAKSTLLLWGGKQDPPFDVAPYLYLPYAIGDDGKIAGRDLQSIRDGITAALRNMQDKRDTRWSDNPLVQLFLEDGGPPEVVAHQKADLFRDWVDYSEEMKLKLAAARSRTPEDAAAFALEEIERGLVIEQQEPGVLMDLLLSYRHVKAWDRMVKLSEVLPEELKKSILVREQRALALNRRGNGNDRFEALAILETLNQQRESSETLALTGRVYKDMWDESRDRNELIAEANLDKAIDCYRRGFRADPRDPYPGINALTLLDVGDRLAERDRLLPVVRYAAERSNDDDYWRHITLFELSILEGDVDAARTHLVKAFGCQPERFAVESTIRNVELLAEARKKRGEDHERIRQLITKMQRAVGGA